jgi:hypothetical protein
MAKGMENAIQLSRHDAIASLSWMSKVAIALLNTTMHPLDLGRQ